MHQKLVVKTTFRYYHLIKLKRWTLKQTVDYLYFSNNIGIHLESHLWWMCSHLETMMIRAMRVRHNRKDAGQKTKTKYKNWEELQRYNRPHTQQHTQKPRWLWQQLKVWSVTPAYLTMMSLCSHTVNIFNKFATARLEVTTLRLIKSKIFSRLLPLRRGVVYTLYWQFDV